MIEPDNELKRISLSFQIAGELLSVRRLRIGHINETYVATYTQGSKRARYIHQKLNRKVFKNPVGVMRNLVRVTSHLRRRLESQGIADMSRHCLTLVPTRQAKDWLEARNGEIWRTFVYVEGGRTFEAVQRPMQAFEAGRAFGEFQRLLSDLPGRRLVETIPHFHDTRNRFETFQAVLDRDPMKRAAIARSEIEFAQQHESIVDVIVNGLANGQIPERVTHNDTKFNNVMLDAQTGQALCVLDLDTVMPGCAVYDFGDMARTTTSPTREDERDLRKVRMRRPLFKALARGYLSEAGQFLTKAERDLMVFSAKLITFEVGLRFLTDHLAGDGYFRIEREGQNLDRCRTQFKLVRSIEHQEEAMQRFVDGL